MNFLDIVNTYKNQLLDDLSKFLQLNTVAKEQPHVEDAPFGENLKEALIEFLKLAESFGFKTKNVDNVAGHVEYGEGEEILGILCHIDVVPAPGKWQYPPFSGTITKDKVYSRGALDNKGPAISSLYALKILKDQGIKLNKRVRLIIGTDEESGFRCVKRYLEVCEMPTLGFSPDAEFPLIYAEKGIMSIDLTNDFFDDTILKLESGDRYNVVPDLAKVVLKEDMSKAFKNYCNNHQLRYQTNKTSQNYELIIHGKSAHAMEPNNGVNALVHMCQFLNQYHSNPMINFIGEKLIDSRFKTINLNYKNNEMGDLTVNVAFAKVNNLTSKAGLNLRYPINWDKHGFLAEFTKQANYYGVNVNKLNDNDVHYVDKNSSLVQTLHKVYKKYTNDDTTPLKTIGGGTYARALDNAVAFGMLMPGREDVVHKVDEYIYIEDLIISTAIITDVIYQLGN